MNITADNPLGLNGFEFVEFTSPDPQQLTALFERLGFVAHSRHPLRDVLRYRQGDINILVNRAEGGQAAAFRAAHGPSANGMAFRVADPAQAYALALSRGALPAAAGASALGENAQVLQGIGGSLLYLVADGGDPYAGWLPLAASVPARDGVGLKRLDHLTHNLRRGHMRDWSAFYSRVFGFREQKYFDIKGQASGLFSQAMMAPDHQIRIPLNESQDARSQIEEFITQYRGEGIQHLALSTDDIYVTVAALRARGVKLQHTPDAYYEQVDRRVAGHGEDLARLRENRILIDGAVGREGLLLQIFTEPLIGPIFFEIIQRKGNEGFGNGNFQALFESIEQDQIRRGVLKFEHAA